jgi:hypothetical protein
MLLVNADCCYWLLLVLLLVLLVLLLLLATGADSAGVNAGAAGAFNWSLVLLVACWRCTVLLDAASAAGRWRWCF